MYFFLICCLHFPGELLNTFCGRPNNLPIVIDVPGSEAYVKFKSNSAVTAKGFSMFMETNYDEGENFNHALIYYLKFHK